MRGSRRDGATRKASASRLSPSKSTQPREAARDRGDVRSGLSLPSLFSLLLQQRERLFGRGGKTSEMPV